MPSPAAVRPRCRHLLLAGLGALAIAGATLAAPFSTGFDDGDRGWRVVLDGVMGGLSTGRLSTPAPGVLRFTGRLSLENNGGFSQIRRAVDGSDFAGTAAIDLRVKGDGRTYTFNVRTSDVRMMATGHEVNFETTDGVWTTVRLPYDTFRLTSFGRPVQGPALAPTRIESIGITLGDKKTGPFQLEIDEIAAVPAGAPAMRARGGAAARPASATTGAAAGADDLATVAGRAGLDTLLQLVALSGIADALPPGELLTVLAPTDEAFAALPPAAVARLTSKEGLGDLRRILAHHVVPGRLTARELFSRRGVESLAGQTLAIEPGAGLTVGGARVLSADVPFDGGLVHVIDTVIQPELRTIAALAMETDGLSTLAAAASTAGLLRQLGPENEGPWTVFAPRDSAFAALPAGTVEALLAPSGRADLARILGGHVIPSRLRLADLTAAGSVRTLAGTPLDIGFGPDGFTVGGAKIVAADIEAANGVVHVIDAVLTGSANAGGDPRSGASGSAGPGAGDPFPEAVELLTRAVDLGAPLFNEGNEAACAVTYRVSLDALVVLAGDRLTSAERRLIANAVSTASRQPASESAWTLREAIDELFRRFAARG